MSHYQRHVLIISFLLVAASAAAQIPTPQLTAQPGDAVRAPVMHAPAVVETTPETVVAVTPVAVAVAVAVPVAEVTAVATPATPAPAATRSYQDARTESRPAYQSAALGSATRNLLRQQVDGDQAGTALPVLGASATLAHQRYLDSFKYPIPERFESSVTSKTPGGN